METYYQKVEKDAQPRLNTSCPDELRDLNLFSDGRKYGVFILDEAHYARRFTSLRSGCMELRKLAQIMIAMSATPLISSPQVRGMPSICDPH